MKSLSFICGIIFFSVSHLSAQTPQLPAKILPETKQNIILDFSVEKIQLDNGLQILLYQDNSVPLISYHTWYRVGSKDEVPGQTGIAHVLEHMGFKGAKRYSGRDFDKVLQSNGITNNAFTSYDYTGYYDDLPSDKLELIMDIESDRMENLALKEEDFKSEIEVIKEERRYRIDNNPDGILNQAVYSTFFKVSTYQNPIIGHMKDLNSMTIQQVRDFWNSYYGPNNAVIVISGDINIRQTKKLIHKYYSHILPRELPENKILLEPTQDRPRSLEIRQNVQNPSLVIVYPAPASGETDAYTLDLIGNILGLGSSSRLHKELVYKNQLASSVSAYNQSLHKAGMFRIKVNLKRGVSSNRVIQLVSNEIQKLITQGLTEKELQKAKYQVMKGYVDSLTTVDGKAYSLAVNEILFGTYKVLFSDLDRYDRVTLEEVKTVAAKYFDSNKKSIIRMSRGM